MTRKRKCSYCTFTGHNVRTCPTKVAEELEAARAAEELAKKARREESNKTIAKDCTTVSTESKLTGHDHSDGNFAGSPAQAPGAVQETIGAIPDDRNVNGATAALLISASISHMSVEALTGTPLTIPASGADDAGQVSETVENGTNSEFGMDYSLQYETSATSPDSLTAMHAGASVASLARATTGGVPYPVFAADGYLTLPSRAPAPRTDCMADVDMWPKRPGGRPWLQHICSMNKWKIVDNLGSGDCAYLAIIDGLRSTGYANVPDVRALRALVADEFSARPQLYDRLFEEPDVLALQNDPGRATNFDTFVRRTRSGQEWAQGPCFYAVPARLPITLRVWDDRLKGVATYGTFETFVDIGYISAAPHYVALVDNRMGHSSAIHDVQEDRPERAIDDVGLAPEPTHHVTSQRAVNFDLEGQDRLERAIDNMGCASEPRTARSPDSRPAMRAGATVPSLAITPTGRVPYPVFAEDGYLTLPSRAPVPRTEDQADVDVCPKRPGGRPWLEHICTINDWKIVDNLGSGDCAYLAIIDGLRSKGYANVPDVRALRALVADELSARPQLYNRLFEEPDSVALQTDPERASNFDTFVRRTRSGQEWAQGPCFYAVPARLPITLRVWDDRLKGVASYGTFETFVDIGYISAAPHYVALVDVDNAMGHSSGTAELQRDCPERVVDDMGRAFEPPHHENSPRTSNWDWELLRRQLVAGLRQLGLSDVHALAAQPGANGLFQAFRDSLQHLQLPCPTVDKLRRACWTEFRTNVGIYYPLLQKCVPGREYSDFLRRTIANEHGNSVHAEALANAYNVQISLYDADLQQTSHAGKTSHMHVRLGRIQFVHFAILVDHAGATCTELPDAYMEDTPAAALPTSFTRSSSQRQPRRTQRPPAPRFPAALCGVTNDSRLCRNCGRRSTDKYNIQLALRIEGFHGRKFGDIPHATKIDMPTLLCELCDHYLHSAAKSLRQLWPVAWPSVIRTLLNVGRDCDNVSTKVWSMLPPSMQSMWDPTTFAMSTSNFVDRTHDLFTVQALRATRDLGYLIEVMDKFGVPDVKCPLGCWAYLDACETIPFMDYITYATGYQLTGSVPENFRSARRDWPPAHKQYLKKYRIAAAMIISETTGLCILYCRGIHESLKRPTLHVPTNPVLRENADQVWETLAPCRLVPHIERKGQVKTWTSSSHVIDARGGYYGISSCSLTTNPSKRLPNLDEQLNNVLVMSQRDDIRNRHLTMPLLRGDAEHNLLILETHRRNNSGVFDEDEIAKALSSGTYISKADAYYMWKAENAAAQRAGENADEMVVKPGKLFIAIVHPCDDYGCRPFCDKAVPLIQQRQCCFGPGPNLAIADVISFILIHCRDVYNYTLMAAVLEQNHFAGSVLSTVANKGHFQSRTQLSMTTSDFGELLSSRIRNLAPEVPDAGAIAHIVSLLVRKCVIVQTDNLISFDSSQLGDDDLLIVVKPYNSRDRTNTLPSDYLHRPLLLILSSQRHEGAVFRWDNSMKWWVVRGKQCNRVADLPDFRHWQFAIYGLGIDVVDIDLLARSLKGQRKYKCWNSEHPNFLGKEPLHTVKICYRQDCTNKAVWGCKFSNVGSECPIGICRTHFAADGDANGMVYLRRDGSVPTLLRSNSDDDAGQVADEDLLAGEAIPDSAEEDDFTRTVDYHTNYNFNADDENNPHPLHTLASNAPLYVPEDSSYVPVHVLLNDKFDVLKRKYRRYQGAQQLNLMQNFAANSGSTGMSLLYPEAQVAPNTFWGLKNGAPVGAMHQSQLSAVNVGNTSRSLRSMIDTIRIRMRDHDLTTAQQHSYIHFSFDLKLNHSMNSYSAALVFTRGVEPLAEKNTLHFLSQDVALPYNESDASVKVREIAALTKRYPWKYWITLTCNEVNTPGIRQVIAAISALCQFPSDYARIYNANVIMLNRMWLHWVELFVDYMVQSPDQLMGPIQHLFARLEFQSAGSPGNKAHVHIGVALHDEPLQETLDRISCNPETVFSNPKYGVDAQSLIEKGIIQHTGEFDKLKRWYTMVSTHDCKNAGGRCMKRRNAAGDLVCRVPKHPGRHDYSFEMKPNLYSADMLERMARIKFAKMVNVGKVDGSTVQELRMTDRRLIGGRHHYPTVSRPTYLPTIPIIQCAMGSSFNCIVCDERFRISYLAKYQVGKEEHGGNRRMQGTKQADVVNLLPSQPHHSKISGQQILHDVAGKKDGKSTVSTIELGLYEIITFLGDSAYTYSTARFIHINTNPPEYRVWRTKPGNFAPAQHYGATGYRSTFIDRRVVDGIPEWRRFTPNQIRHASDYAGSNFSYSNTERFNIRPPELLAITSLLLYHEIVIYTGCSASALHFRVSPDPLQDGLYDALGKQVKIRLSGIAKLQTLTETFSEQARNAPSGAEASDCHGSSANFLKELVGRLVNEDRSSSGTAQLFVDDRCRNEVIAVPSTVYPNRQINFLYHLVLTLGKFETEFDVFDGVASFKEAFHRAGILPLTPRPTESQALDVFKGYMDKECLDLPIGKNRLERTAGDAEKLIFDVILFSGPNFTQLPVISELAIRESAEESIMSIELERRRTLATALHAALSAAGMQNMPQVEDVVNCTLANPIAGWAPPFSADLDNNQDDLHGFLPSVPHQSRDSVLEQIRTFKGAFSAMQCLKNPDPDVAKAKFPCICGPPGCGKTLLLQLLAYVAMSEGYRVCVLSLTSERSRVLGGIHIHQIFPLEVVRGRSESPERTYAHVLQALKKDATKMVLLQRTDMFFFEEIGLVSAELYAIMDSVMRDIVKKDTPFGGKFVMVSGDPCQLPPPEGVPFWTSVHLLASFNVLRMQHYVRSATDPRLQNIITLMRAPRLTPEQVQNIVGTLQKHCHFPANWDGVPEQAMRIVSTRQAEEAVISDYIREKLQDPAIKFSLFRATDEVFQGQTLRTASAGQLCQINREVLEPNLLYVFEGAVLRLTYNNMSGPSKFSQGQLCIVESVPDGESLAESAVAVRIVPPGVRNFRTVNTTWPALNVRRRYTSDVLLHGGYHGRRLQLPLRYYKANTIHRIMGETCAIVATEINNVDESKRYLRLWENAQLLVLISRVHSLESLYFVGPRHATMSTITDMLNSRDFWHSFIDERLAVATGSITCYLANSEYPYTFTSKEIPQFTSGIVYFLVSLRYPSVTYIGQTGRSLKRRLAEHNSGSGTAFTSRVEYMPWAPLAIIHGFPVDVTEVEGKRQRLMVERYIHSHVRRRHLPETVVSIARALLARQLTTPSPLPFLGNLILERLGRLRRQRGTGVVEVEDCPFVLE